MSGLPPRLPRPRSRAERAARNADRRRVVLGVMAVAIVIVVGYVGYTANSGLPGVSRAEYTLDLPDAQRLIKAADVRIGGVRVGEVLRTDAALPPGRPPRARVRIALEKDVGPLPIGTTARVRPASVLGLTYVDIVLGRGPRRIAEGGTIPAAAKVPSPELTDLFDVFDRRYAGRFQEAVRGVSGGLAGRGTALNAATQSLDGLLPPLDRVMATLAAPPTRLPAFVSGADTASAAVDPVRDELAGLVAGGAGTFDALARERRALGETIDQAPATETAVGQALTVVQPGLRQLARTATALRPAAVELPRALREINATLRTGVTPLRTVPRLTQPLRSTLTAVRGLARDPDVKGGLRQLTGLAKATAPAISGIVPAQLSCNIVSLFTQNFAGVFGTQGTDQGPSLASLFLSTMGGTNEGSQNATPSAQIGINPTPHMNAQECESGNEPWKGGQQIGNPAGLQPASTRPSVPPPGVAKLAEGAGLLADPEGIR